MDHRHIWIMSAVAAPDVAQDIPGSDGRILPATSVLTFLVGLVQMDKARARHPSNKSAGEDL